MTFRPLHDRVVVEAEEREDRVHDAMHATAGGCPPSGSGAGAGKLRERRAHRDRAEDRATGALPPYPSAGPQLRWSGFSGRSERVRRHR